MRAGASVAAFRTGSCVRSLIAAIRHIEAAQASQDVDGILVHLVDHPFIEEKLVDVMLDKFYQSYCLVDQGFVKKNSEVSVKEHVGSVAKQLGDEITIRRFVRFQVGESAAA